MKLVESQVSADSATPSLATNGEPSKPASHDNGPPQALVDFMLKDWDTTPLSVEPIAAAAAHLARRRALSKLFPGEALVIPTGHEQVRANDTHYRFRPGTEFFYLTGNHEPDGVLLLLPLAEGGHRDILFAEPNPGRTSPAFFTDRVKGELWVGKRLGVPESKVRFGVDEARGLGELGSTLERLAAQRETQPLRVLRGLSPSTDGRCPAWTGDAKLGEVLSEMRLRKDADEVKELRISIEATRRGFEDVIRKLPGARTERVVEGVFGLRARVDGNDVGYGTIAASGSHACTLHWTRNDGPLSKDDLLLLDAGVEGHSLYTADITRTLPISGRFSAAQRRVYDLVEEAREAAMAEVRPGADFLAPNRAAMKVLARGLVELGVLRVSADEALDEQKQLFKRYTLHNVSHMLGLDVHDCAKARQETYRFGKLEAGMVLTIEPGLYFQTDDLTVPPELRGIGVRIEDDVLVTEEGHDNLSGHLPTKSADVEAWMASVWAGPPGDL